MPLHLAGLTRHNGSLLLDLLPQIGDTACDTGFDLVFDRIADVVVDSIEPSPNDCRNFVQKVLTVPLEAISN